jgi:hypothetical protein
MAIQKRRFSLTTVSPRGSQQKTHNIRPSFRNRTIPLFLGQNSGRFTRCSVKVPVGYPSSRVDVADFGRPFRDFGQKTKIRPKVPPPKNLGLMLGFLETGEVFVRAGG